MLFTVTTQKSSAGPGVPARALAVVLGAGLLLAVFGVVLALQRTVPGAATAARLDGDGLYNLTNVWHLRLTFTPEQWQAMEPKGGAGPFGGRGGPGGFGPGAELGGVVLSQGDANQDQQLSRDEFVALGRKWMTAWDTNKTGQLDAGKIRTGLEAALLARAGGGPRVAKMAGQMASGPVGNRNGYPLSRANLDFEGWQFEEVAVRYKGNNTYMSSSRSLKRPLKIDLNSGFKGRRLGGITELNLHNNVNDAGAMNEALSYRLFRDAGVPGPRTAYAQIFLSVQGQYTNHLVGLYSLIENVDKDFTSSRFGTRRGALFKPRTRQVFEDMGDQWAAYQPSFVPNTTVYDHEAQRVIDFSKLVSHASDAEFAARLEEFLDLDAFARFMAVTVWLSNMDSILSMGQNFYVYLHPKTQRFQFLPWDFDHSFGMFPMAGSAEELENLSLLKPWSGRVLFLERVFNFEKFKRIYLARMEEFSKTIFQPERIQQQVDALAAVLRPVVREESDQLLARFEKVVTGEAAVGEGFGGPPPGENRGQRSFGMRRGEAARAGMGEGVAEPPFGGPGGDAPGGPGGFGSAMKPIRTFVVARAASVNDQLSGKSAGVTLSRSGPGGPPGMGGGPGGPPGMGGPGGFGPGMFLARAFLAALDDDDDGALSETEVTRGFETWFDSWSKQPGANLDETKLQSGINQDLSPLRGGPPRGLDFGPPPMGFGPPGGPDDF